MAIVNLALWKRAGRGRVRDGKNSDAIQSELKIQSSPEIESEAARRFQDEAQTEKRCSRQDRFVDREYGR